MYKKNRSLFQQYKLTTYTLHINYLRVRGSQFSKCENWSILCVRTGQFSKCESWSILSMQFCMSNNHWLTNGIYSDRPVSHMTQYIVSPDGQDMKLTTMS